MVMLACASVVLYPSSSNLISSSIFSGALPVFGSSPMLPAMYSVSPARMALLYGACTGLSGRLMARRFDGESVCENAPSTVAMTGSASSIANTGTRRFMTILPKYEIRLSMMRECIAAIPTGASRNPLRLTPAAGASPRVSADQSDNIPALFPGGGHDFARNEEEGRALWRAAVAPDPSTRPAHRRPADRAQRKDRQQHPGLGRHLQAPPRKPRAFHPGKRDLRAPRLPTEEARLRSH